MPGSSKSKPGVIRVRGNIISLIDLRLLMGMESLAQEQDDFEKMLEQRKHDHQHWVEELEHCLDTDETFHLAVDPHQCAFGKWYDHYETDVQSVNYHLRKIDAPHRALHHTAYEAFSCPRHCDTCEREQCLRDKLREDANTYMHIVVKLLDEAKQVFRESYRTMCVIVSSPDGHQVGLLVDEVIVVEKLTAVQPLPDCFYAEECKKEPLVAFTAERTGDPTQIMLLNTDTLFKNDTER